MNNPANYPKFDAIDLKILRELQADAQLRERIKRETIANRRLQHRLQAA